MGLKWLVFFKGHHVFDGYAIQWGSKSRHHKDVCLKEIGLRFQLSKTTLHSTINIVERTYVSTQEINNHKQIKGGLILQSGFCICFIVDLLMQHKLCCVNMIDRSQTTWKTNQITPKYLMIPTDELLIDLQFWER